jgi:hypothetical protein
MSSISVSTHIIDNSLKKFCDDLITSPYFKDGPISGDVIGSYSPRTFGVFPVSLLNPECDPIYVPPPTLIPRSVISVIGGERFKSPARKNEETKSKFESPNCVLFTIPVHAAASPGLNKITSTTEPSIDVPLLMSAADDDKASEDMYIHSDLSVAMSKEKMSIPITPRNLPVKSFGFDVEDHDCEARPLDKIACRYREDDDDMSVLSCEFGDFDEDIDDVSV